MKKLLFGMLVAATLGFSSCGKDSKTDDKPTGSPILGQWEMTDYNVRLRDSMMNGSLFDTTITETYAAGSLTFNFLSNGKVINTEIVDGETYNDTGNYEFVAPVLKMWGTDETIADAAKFNVTFSGSNVALKADDEYMTTDFEGIPVTLKLSMTINGKKK
jgi:hypothetical protein